MAPLVTLSAERELPVSYLGRAAGPRGSRNGRAAQSLAGTARTGRPGGARGMSAEQQSSVGKRNRRTPADGPRAAHRSPRRAVETDRDQLVIAHVGLVKALAQRLAQRLPSQVEMTDLISVGVLGLIDAAGRYKPALGVPFDAFARRRVQGAMLDALRDLDWAPRSLRRHAPRTRRRRRRGCAHELEREPDRGRNRRRDVDVAGRVRQGARPAPHAGARRHPPARRDRRRRLAAARAVHRSRTKAPDAQLERKELRDAAGAGAISELPERERQILALYYEEELTHGRNRRGHRRRASRACRSCARWRCRACAPACVSRSAAPGAQAMSKILSQDEIDALLDVGRGPGSRRAARRGAPRAAQSVIGYNFRRPDRVIEGADPLAALPARSLRAQRVDVALGVPALGHRRHASCRWSSSPTPSS